MIFHHSYQIQESKVNLNTKQLQHRDITFEPGMSIFRFDTHNPNPNPIFGEKSPQNCGWTKFFFTHNLRYILG